MKTVVKTLGAKIRRITISFDVTPCKKCGTVSKRHSIGKRLLREVGISTPTVLEVTYSKHYCIICNKYFSVAMDHLAAPGALFTKRVRRTAVDMVLKESMILDAAVYQMKQKYHVLIPPTTLHDWVQLEKSNTKES